MTSRDTDTTLHLDGCVLAGFHEGPCITFEDVEAVLAERDRLQEENERLERDGKKLRQECALAQVMLRGDVHRWEIYLRRRAALGVSVTEGAEDAHP